MQGEGTPGISLCTLRASNRVDIQRTFENSIMLNTKYTSDHEKGNLSVSQIFPG